MLHSNILKTMSCTLANTWQLLPSASVLNHHKGLNIHGNQQSIHIIIEKQEIVS